MRNLDPVRARWIRVRIGLLCGVMGVAAGGVVSSAYRVQVEDAPQWREIAERQRQRRLRVEPKRGTIYDRNGTPLAVSIEVPSVSIDVAETLRGVEGKAQEEQVLRDAAARLGQALAIDANDLYAKLATRKRFLWVKRRVSAEEAQAVRDLGDPKKQVRPIRGLAIDGEGKRYYPGRSLAGPVIGFVAPDGFGKDGLELSLDDELRGHALEVKGLRDRSGRLVFSEGDPNQQMAGHDVQLAIDEGIQHVAERELDAAMRTYETRGGSVIVVDPQTGEILALASAPSYNPNDYSDSDPDARRDRAVTDRFEPGSVMKVFTVAIALAAGTLNPTETIYCERGSYQLGPVVIHDTHVSEWLTPTQILAKSSNIGALKIGLGVGEAGLYAGLRRFGFGEPTGLPLPGEASGVLRPRGRPWFDVETANASFGQGISVTALQLAMGFAAIANGGKLLEPILVRKVTDARGETVREWAPRVRREAVPASVARLVADMLTAVTEAGGTGVEAQVPGFRVAGKTATAQKADPSGRYGDGKFTASFVGFLPAEKPRLVVAVVLDEPMIGHYGGDLAGPVFRRVAESSLRFLGVTPPGSAKIVSASRKDDPADATLAAFKLPAAPLPAEPSADPAAPPREGAELATVPDATGLPAREAARLLGEAGFVPRIVGTGRLVRQTPAAGTQAPRGSVATLVLENAS